MGIIPEVSSIDTSGAPGLTPGRSPRTFSAPSPGSTSSPLLSQDALNPQYPYASQSSPPFLYASPSPTASVVSSNLSASPVQSYGHHSRSTSSPLPSQDASHLQHPHAYHSSPTTPPPPPFLSASSSPTATAASSNLSAGPAQGYGHHSRSISSPLPSQDASHLQYPYAYHSPPPPPPPFPQTPSASTSSPLPSQYALNPQYLPAHLPTSRYIPESGHPYPTSPTPQVWVTHVPTTHSGPPSPQAHRSSTIPNPELHNTHVSPQAEPHPSCFASQPLSLSHSQSHPGMSGVTQIPVDYQRIPYDSYHEEVYQDDHDNSATHSGNAIPRGRPDPPFAGPQVTQVTSNDTSNGFLGRILRKLNRSRSRTPTPAPQVTAPQQATFCRFPGCHNETGATDRLKGFCSDGHRDMSLGTL
ncbi:hypothetical protein H4582DRAFT_1917695 [Lactarius indigo]|nr:hypothetical protein H4582DRAFT_1917695 [Lactarius indigo]